MITIRPSTPLSGDSPLKCDPPDQPAPVWQPRHDPGLKRKFLRGKIRVHIRVRAGQRPLTRKQIYVKRLVDKFRQAHPDADVIDRAMFTAAASKTWRP